MTLNTIHFNEDFSSETQNGLAVFSASVNGHVVGTFQFIGAMIVFTSLDDDGNAVTVRYDDSRQLVDYLKAMKIDY